MTYPFLNFRVGFGQRGFRIKEVKCVGRNLFPAICFRQRGFWLIGVRTNRSDCIWNR